MRVPGHLDQQLRSDSGLHGAVEVAVESFRPWLEQNRLTFFPEYTDHGTKHVEEVLGSAESLIQDEAWQILGPEDAAVLILSVLLHDVAMHLTSDGFAAMIEGRYQVPPIPQFADRPWSLLWEDFMAEARRFDGRKLMSLFGTTDPIARPKLENLTDRDRLLVGEFVRRHHARLAHEIALHGVPGPTENRIRLGDINESQRDLAGLVARSHGLPLRACLDYLKKKYHGVKQCCRVRVPYLMSILRVADYLQIQAGRAPQQVLKVQRLRSPLSVREWSVHHAVRDIRIADDDPEALFVDAMPKDVHTFLRLQRLLRDIQTELDASWSVLGEVYGTTMPQFGLKLRRIRSNLDDIATFETEVDYVPREAYFKAAHGDLLGLLAAPLYGDKPEVGIRELMQNSVDAVLELREFLSLHPEFENRPRMDIQADVIIHLYQDDTGYWVEVSDRGIGMTADTVVNYFLNAGASFRRSDAWRKTFEDDQGKSRVMRSGRFGIGVLAAFLLGPEVSVCTRHIEADDGQGVEFSVTLETESVALRKVQCPVGTRIRIRLSSTTWSALQKKNLWEDSWDWYCLSDPRVLRITNGEHCAQGHWVPKPGESELHRWRQLPSDDYSAIHWRYPDREERVFACNGILLNWIQVPQFEEFSTKGFRSPSVSIFDPDGRLPLNLQRTELTREASFGDNLHRAVIRDYIAFVLLTAPTEPLACQSLARWSTLLRAYAGANRSEWLYASAPGGILLLTERLILSLGMRRVAACTQVAAKPEILDLVCTNTALRCWGVTSRIRESGYMYSALGNPPWERLEELGSRIVLPRVQADSWLHPLGRYGGLLKEYRIEWQGTHWVVLARGDCPPGAIDFNELEERCANPDPSADGPWLMDTYLDENPVAPEDDPVGKAWLEIVGTPIIPYDMAERRRKLAHAFEELREEIAFHEAELRTQATDT